MRIGLDGRPLLGRRTGIGRYVFEICRELDAVLPNAEFYVYVPEPVELPVASPRWCCRVETSSWARGLKPIAWLKLRAGRLCRRDHLDVFWGSATLFPRLPADVRRVSTVYDLAFRLAPETMGRTHLIAHRMFFERDVRRADHLVAISNGTAARLQAWLGGPLPSVAPPAAALAFRPSDSRAVAHTLAGFGITVPFFLAVGTWEPRKNLELLVQVFRALRAAGEFLDYQLVLAGGAGWKDERLRDLLGVSGTLDARVVTAGVMAVGFVPDELLAHLYAGCRAFVFPSRYEGFGLPVLEARACGAPVVASDLPEIREAGGDGGIYIPPTPDGLRYGLRHVVSASPALPHASDFLPTWRDSATVLARYLIAV
jgi:glycosyltransferase involved in cell wall biosynthesis